MSSLIEACFLGIVEGLTEFLPISSTGHLIVFIDLLAFRGPSGRSFEVVIQLGAIFAVCWVYRRRLIDTVIGLHKEPSARHFALLLLVAFLPSLFFGVVFHSFIKSTLFNPWTVSTALIAGGAAILVIERIAPVPTIREMSSMQLGRAFAIGLCQAVAMFPGVSRSGATIMGGLLLGLDRKSATEFSFFLAIPTMLGAAAFDLHKNSENIAASDAVLIMVGFSSAFLAALVTVRFAIGFVSRHGFAPFAWYRIALGSLMFLHLLSR